MKTDTPNSATPKTSPATTASADFAKATLPRGKPAPANELSSGEEKRRSQRVLLRMRAQVHVALQGKPATLDVITLSVNAHGALVAMKQQIPAETRLILEHAMTKERIACRVVRPPRESSEGFQTALEFDAPSPDFWKIAFPPANWRAEDV